MFRKLLLICLPAVSLFAATPPPNWGDFQMGLVNNGRAHWDGAMKEALETQVGGKCPYQLDRRYIYMDDTTNMKAYWGTDGVAKNNWSRNSYYESKGVRPAIVIYMLQRGGDSWSAVEAGMGSKDFMKAYFKYIATIADSSKGTKPIFVIEPDVWSYMLQQARENDPNRQQTGDDWSKIQDNNFESVCHINDLGYPWLSEFENKASNLPGAIIKTLKTVDPESYAGILIGFWGFQPTTTTGIGLFTNSSDVIGTAARETARFANALLSSTPYRGDFAGLEKNGQDMGYWAGTYKTAFDWDDRQNGDWVKFAKSISDSTQLPMIGWQISIGHRGLPNTLNAFEDSFFPYFFTHTQEFMDAGVIGMLAGCAGQDRGTMAVVPGGKTYANPSFGESTKGDEGWFYTEYAKFNTNRPWVANANKVMNTVIAEVMDDSVFTAGEVTDPAWDPTANYGAWDDPAHPHGMFVSYQGRKYEFTGWSCKVGVPPTEQPDVFVDRGIYGTLEVTTGGTVWNNNIYYEPGSNVTHTFNPKPIDGYGIGCITVNGDTVASTDRIVINGINKNYQIKVKFVKDDGTLVRDFHGAAKSVESVMFSKSGITLNHAGTVELFTPNGRLISSKALNSGDQFPLTGIAAGTYIARISGAGAVFSKMVTVH